MDKRTSYDQPPPYTPYANTDRTMPGVHGMYTPTSPPPQPQTFDASAPIINNYYPTYGATPVTTATVIVPPEIIVIGACPACRIGILEDDYPCLALFCAIFFFPIGIFVCLALKNKRCSNCGAIFG